MTFVDEFKCPNDLMLDASCTLLLDVSDVFVGDFITRYFTALKTKIIIFFGVEGGGEEGESKTNYLRFCYVFYDSDV
jgi:uncharacterized protein (UPF0276 family)